MEKGKLNMSTFKEGFIKYGLDHGYIKPKKKKEQTITFEDNGAPLKKSKNRQGETCEAALRRSPLFLLSDTCVCLHFSFLMLS